MTLMCSSRIYVFNDFRGELQRLRMCAVVVYLIGTTVYLVFQSECLKKGEMISKLIMYFK